MAIKIINKGKDPDNPIFTQRCPKCDCVFTYQKKMLIENLPVNSIKILILIL